MSSYSIDQMNLLGKALKTAGFKSGDVTKLRKFKGLANFRAVLDGLAEIVAIKPVIDCDADLADLWIENWKIEKHIKGGQFEWDPSQVVLYLNRTQRNGGYTKGETLLRKMSGKKAMNVCVRDFLVAHQEFIPIPEEWKSVSVLFWGTLFRNFWNDELCVPGMYWDDEEEKFKKLLLPVRISFASDNSAALYK